MTDSARRKGRAMGRIRWMTGAVLVGGLALGTGACKQPDAGHRWEGRANESQKAESFTREQGERGPTVDAPQAAGAVDMRVDEASRQTNLQMGTPELSAEAPATGAGGYTTGLEPRDGGLGVGGAGYVDQALRDAEQQQQQQQQKSPPPQQQQAPAQQPPQKQP